MNPKFWINTTLSFLRIFKEVVNVKPNELVFIHREISPLFGSVLLKFFSRKTKIVYDFDDSLSQPIKLQQVFYTKEFSERFYDYIKRSNLVLAGNDYLKSKVEHQKKIVVPTTIDLQGLHKKRKVYDGIRPTVLGWTGTHSTLPYLQRVVSHFRRSTSQWVQV